MREQLKAEADRLFQKGIQQYQNSQFQVALQPLAHALDIYRRVPDHLMEGRALGNLGIVYYRLGNYLRAIECQQKHLVIAKTILDCPREEMSPLGNLAIIYKGIGNYSKALELYTKVLYISQKIKDHQAEAKTLGNIGNIYYEFPEYTTAIEYHERDLAFMKKLKNFEGQGEALANLGLAYEAIGEYSTAIKHYQKSLSIARKRKIKNKKGEVIVLGLLGIIFKIMGKPIRAVKYHQQSLIIARAIKYSVGEGVALNNIGSALLEIGNYPGAEKRLYEGIQVWESLRAGLGSNDDYKVSIFEQQARTYRLLQKVLIEQNKTDEALEIAERGRARALIDLLTSRLYYLASIQSTATSPSINQIKQTASIHSSTLVQYSIVYDTDATKGKEVQAIESELFTWVIKPTGEITFRPVHLQPLRQEQNTSLSNLVSQARESLGINDELSTVRTTANSEAPKLLRQLHEILIQPIADLLPDNPEEPVIFIPQQSLFLVPFAALLDPTTGKFLIEQHIILTAPSIQVLDSTRKRQQHLKDEWASKKDEKNSDLYLVVGNPTMPFIPKIGQPPEQLEQLEGAEEQARTIAKLLNTQPIIRDDATKVNVVQQMLSARLIHLATHGLLDDIRELGVPAGAIALAPTEGVDNGFLTAGEILELKLKAELVVLSACLTGLGKVTGDGVIGLSRCLFLAGVPSVIVSLWSVPDEPTQYLMIEFYGNLQGGMNKAKALRQAILTTKQKFRSPVNWAGFTLIGESE
jgi:CHAT domain-containing protein